MLNVEVARRRVSRVSDPCPLRRHRLHAVSVSSSKTVASVTSIERDYRGRAANERSSQRQAVPGDPHDAQTPAVRPHSSAQSHFDVYIARSSKTVASVTSIERDYRGRAANERLSHRRAVPGDPHGAQTPAVRLQWGVWAL